MLRHLRVVTARVSASGILSGERAEWATKWPSTVLTCFRVRSVPHGRLAVWACASAQGTALARPLQKKVCVSVAILAQAWRAPCKSWCCALPCGPMRLEYDSTGVPCPTFPPEKQGMGRPYVEKDGR